MNLNKFLEGHPQIKLATPEDNKAILDFFETLPMEGKEMVISYDRGPNFFDFLNFCGPNYFVFMIKMKNGDIGGVGTLVLRPGRINDEKKWVGYLGDLRVKADRRASVWWRKFYGDLIVHAAEIEEFGGCKYFYTSILNENTKAHNALVLNKKNPFQYFHMVDYEMVNIMLRYNPWPSWNGGRYSYSQSDGKDKEEIVKFLAKQNKERSFGFCLEETYDELNFRIHQWKQFKWDNFIVVRDLKGKIVGVTLLWTPSPVKRIMIKKMPAFLKLYFSIQGLIKKSPKEGGELEVLYLNFLEIDSSLKEEQSDIFKNLVHFIYNLPVAKDFHALSFCAFKGSPYENLGGFLTHKTALSLYTVTLRGNEEKVTLGDLPPGFEMSLV